MFSSKPLQPHKISQEEFDSADELDSSATEDHIVFQKIPSQQTKLNAHLFTSNPSEHDLSLKDRTNSPDQGYNQYKPKGYSKEGNDEALKKLIYNTSPKQAANEYLQNSKLQAQNQIHQKQQKRGGSPTVPKAHQHPFHHPQDINKENFQQEEQNNFVTSNFDQMPEASAYTELANKIYAQKFLTNNQSRKTNVANAADNHLLLSTGAARKIEEKRYLASKEIQEEVVNRLANQSNTTEFNKSKMSNYVNKELEECTFVPRTTDTGPKRDLSQFLHDQEQFLLKAEEKKRRLQEQALLEQSKAEPSYKPEICQGSKKILEKKKVERTPVYQRLYNVGKNSQTKHMQGIAERERIFSSRDSVESSHFIGVIDTKGDLVSPTNQQINSSNFIPTIHKKSKNLKRGDRIENLLYNDAIRRQHKVLESSKTLTKSSVVPLSSTSKRALATRFIKEFDIGILEFLEMEKEPKLNYLQLNEFLKKLCFLKESEYIENPYFTPERLLLYDMWYLLQADKFKGIHRRNLLVFLLAVLDLHFPITKIQKHEEGQFEDEENNEQDKSMNGDGDQMPITDQQGNPILPEDEDHPPRERKNIGNMDEDGNFELAAEEVKKIHKMFELWHINRICSADNIGQLIKLRNHEEPTHQPQINETSKQLAQVYREKMLGGTAELIQQNKIPPPKDGKLTHADLLIISKKVSKEKVNRFGELLKEEEVKDCTFKPHITQYDSTVSMSSVKSPHHESRDHRNKPNPTATGKARMHELYSLAKPRILKQDKTQEEVDFERNYEECTFQPNVNLKRDQINRQSAELYVRGIDKTVERMKQARIEREQQKNFNQRGFTTGKEGYFVFATDKKKFGNSNYIEKSELRREHQPTNSTDQYRAEYNYERDMNHNEMYQNAQMMREDDNQDTQGYMNYEQNARNYPYRMEQDQGNEDQDQNEEYIEENPNEEEMNQSTHERQTHNEEDLQREEEHENDNLEENERVPLLFVDVNLGHGRTERIIVYEGDRPDELAHRFSEEHNLDLSMKGRLKELLDSQIAGLLSRIDEEATSAHSETERHKYGDYYNQFGQIQEEEDYNE